MTEPARTLPPPYRQLADADPVLASLIDASDDSDAVFRRAGVGVGAGATASETDFAALALHILGQQVSTRAAMAISGRLQAYLGGPPTPCALASTSSDTYRGLGVSRQKASSLRDLAQRHLAGELDVARMAGLNDDDAVRALTAVKGIGRWTAEMFLIHQLHRDDVLPAGDVGVRKAVQLAYGLTDLPNEDQVRRLGRAWAPYRTLATRLLWASLPARPAAAPRGAAHASVEVPTSTVRSE